MKSNTKSTLTRAIHGMLAFSMVALTATGCGGCRGDNNTNNVTTPPNNANNTTSPNNTAPCAEGSANCPCKAGDMCDAGLICDTGTCVGMSASGLTVSSDAARACDLVIEEQTARVLAAGGDDSVEVVHKRRAPRVAVSFMSKADAPIAAGVVTLQSTGDTSGFAIASATCYGADGAVIDGVEVTLE